MERTDLKTASHSVQSSVELLGSVQSYFMLGSMERMADGLFAAVAEVKGSAGPAACIGNLIDAVRTSSKLLPPVVDDFRAAAGELQHFDDLSAASVHELAHAVCAKFVSAAMTAAANGSHSIDRDSLIRAAANNWAAVRTALIKLSFAEVDTEVIVASLQVELAKALPKGVPLVNAAAAERVEQPASFVAPPQAKRLTVPGAAVRKAIEMIRQGGYRDRQILEVSKVKNQQALEAIKSRLKHGKYNLDWLTS